MELLRSRKPIQVVKLSEDLEVHVNKVTVNHEGGSLAYGEVREYVPSTDTYTRGLLIPLSAISDIADGLSKVVSGG